MNVLCVDGSRAFRELLGLAIDLDPDLTLVGAVTTAEEAMAIVAEQPVDVVVMDYDLPGANGIHGSRALKAAHPDVRVVMLTGFAGLDLLIQAATARVDAFLAKSSSSVVDIITSLKEPTMELELDAATIDAVRSEVNTHGHLNGHQWHPHLTPREREVLGLMGRGMDPQTIARQLRITRHTSRGYVRSLLVKLGAHSQLEAVVIAARSGLLSDLSIPSA